MLDLRRLRYFLMVAQELHFGRAALRLHLAQPPLTRQISALEAELGFRLFQRSSRAVSLTSEGQAFLPYARAVLEQMELAQAIAGKLASGCAGQLTLGFASSIALSSLFSEAIRVFGQRFPEVELSLIEGASASQWPQIVDGRIDIGFSRLHPGSGHDGLDTLALADEELIAAIPSADPLAALAEVSLAQLSERPLIRFPDDYGSGLNQIQDHLYHDAGVRLVPGASGRQITSIIALVAAGQGVALVPRCTAALALAGVTYRPVENRQARASLLLHTRRQGRSKVVDGFIAIVRELVGSPP